MTTNLDTWCRNQPGRCAQGYSLATQHAPGFHECPESPASEWQVFTSALKAVARDDGTVHQGDMRPRIRGVIQPARIGQLYRKARDQGLISDTGEREPSNDAAGRNLDKLDRIYALRSAA